jgi:four helix bundle protein
MVVSPDAADVESATMSTGLRELRVWQESVALAGDVVRALRGSVKRETKVVSDRVMATALDISDHIAEGYGRHHPFEQRESYIAAKCALLRLESELAVARHADLVAAGVFTEICARGSQVARLLTGYLVYLERQIAEREPASTSSTASPPAAATRGSVRAPA